MERAAAGGDSQASKSSCGPAGGGPNGLHVLPPAGSRRLSDSWLALPARMRAAATAGPAGERCSCQCAAAGFATGASRAAQRRRQATTAQRRPPWEYSGARVVARKAAISRRSATSNWLMSAAAPPPSTRLAIVAATGAHRMSANVRSQPTWLQGARPAGMAALRSRLGIRRTPTFCRR